MKSAFFIFVLIFAITCTKAESINKSQLRNTMKFGMQAVIIAAEGKGDELANIMLEASKSVSKMDGCILYLVQQSLTDTSKILITEVWDNKESHAASLTNPDVRALIIQAKPIIVGMDHNPAKFIGAHGI
jgi:quinol monooxygenase YgiN